MIQVHFFFISVLLFSICVLQRDDITPIGVEKEKTAQLEKTRRPRNGKNADVVSLFKEQNTNSADILEKGRLKQIARKEVCQKNENHAHIHKLL